MKPKGETRKFCVNCRHYWGYTKGGVREHTCLRNVAVSPVTGHREATEGAGALDCVQERAKPSSGLDYICGYEGTFHEPEEKRAY